jgi:hypothetical protein
MLAAIEISVKVLLCLAVWALLASPFFVAAFFVGRAIKRRRRNSSVVTALLAVVVAVLVAPVPTPIITFFVPNGFALVSGYYYDVFSDGGFATQLLPWVAASLVATLAIACAVAFHYLAEGVTSE